MSNKRVIENIICNHFLKHLCEKQGRELSVKKHAEKPDIICIDNKSGKDIGIEVTELLQKEQGCDRNVSAESAKIVRDVLGKYAKGGIVSIGYVAELPNNKKGQEELGNALEIEIQKYKDFQSFVNKVNLNEWEHRKFVISHICVSNKENKWETLTDWRREYQAHEVKEDELLLAIKRKANLSITYKEVDELILVIRNPHAYWDPTEKIRKEIAKIENLLFDSIWLVNWKMDAIPIKITIYRLDEEERNALE